MRWRIRIVETPICLLPRERHFQDLLLHSHHPSIPFHHLPHFYIMTGPAGVKGVLPVTTTTCFASNTINAGKGGFVKCPSKRIGIHEQVEFHISNNWGVFLFLFPFLSFSFLLFFKPPHSLLLSHPYPYPHPHPFLPSSPLSPLPLPTSSHYTNYNPPTKPP